MSSRIPLNQPYGESPLSPSIPSFDAACRISLPPRDISAQSRLSNICGRADVIAIHLGDMIVRLKPDDGIVLIPNTPPPNSVHGLLDTLEELMNQIGNRVEYIAARL